MPPTLAHAPLIPLLAVAVAGCSLLLSEPTFDRDAGPDAGLTRDSGADGGVSMDAGVPTGDGGPSRDAGDSPDAGTDAGRTDAGPSDGGRADAGSIDAGMDAGTPTDAGHDGGVIDAGFDGGGAPAITAVTTGSFHACAIADLRLYCWGRDTLGQLGDGASIADRHSPVPVSPGGAVARVTAGDDGTCVLLGDGRVRCWGANSEGQSGDGTSLHPRPTPVDVVPSWPGTATVRDLQRGWLHSCAVTSDDHLWCWGSNRFVALGDRTTPALSPIRLFGSELPAVSRVDPFGPSCVVDGSGGVQCWGENTDGQLGDGSTDPSTVPVAAIGLTGPIAEVRAGGYHACARSSTGTVWCWGRNGEGECGDGTTTGPRATPVSTGLTDARELAVGFQHSCVVRTGGEVACWGRNDEGEVGDGTMDDAPSPVRVPLPRAATAVSAGGNFTCAILDDASLWCWGANGFGQLGRGFTSSHSPTPVRVATWGP